ncbi:MAG TPA: hydroxyisourate hydrolase [Candidatus Dormibacteraeota bacterium]|nr:hydroxyisourate hydrolase [Candidatus Dormibacteraeota bacterium]
MTGITTHVLDTAGGRPVAGLTVRLARRSDTGDWEDVGRAVTDEDGRVHEWRGAIDEPTPGQYRLTFLTGPYFVERDVDAFYPEVSVVFLVAELGEHHHVPLLLSPFGYTTYRGS